MDPLTAVSLASNVIQFVGFAGELISKGKEISRNADGALVENLELEAVTDSLLEMSANLISLPGAEPSVSECELLRLCEGSRELAGALLAALQKLKVSNSRPRAWKSFRQALNSVLSAENIEQLSARLERYQRQIHTALLVSLREQLQDYEYRRNASARNLDQRLQHFIDSTQKWQVGFIQSLRQCDRNSNKEHDMHLLATMLHDGAEADRRELYIKQIHHSLLFPEIEERRERIAEAHKRTFEWIFHGTSRTSCPDDVAPDSAPPQWDSFTGWLRGDRNTPYWITGKPGSGKSTLMKYLYHEERTLAHIKHWSLDRPLISAGFFFWNSGTVMQMSFLGLLQSLLYQCVSTHPEIIPRIFPTRWQNCLLYGRDLHPWSALELSNALKTLVAMKEFRFMIFIDGLDEFDKDPSELAAFIVKLGEIACHNLKLCLASRPWLIFEETFRRSPSLRVENLTRDDIRIYVEEKLEVSSRWEDLITFQADAATGLMTEIVDKASGVFLWVVLVVSSLLDGLRDGDTMNDLFDRLGQLPTQLEDLFRKILDQLNPEYFVQASELFQLVESAVKPLMLLDVSYAIEGYEESMKAPVATVKEAERTYRAETMRRRIQSRCKGLLESPLPRLRKHKATVQYLHRTVRDFIRNRTIWEYIVSGAPVFEAVACLCGSYLKQVKTASRYPVDPSIVGDFWESFGLCTLYAKEWERSKNDTPMELFDELEIAGNVYWGALSENRIWDQIVGERQAGETVPHWANTSWLVADVPGRTLETQVLYDSFFSYCFGNEFNSYIMAKIQDKNSEYAGLATANMLLLSAVRSVNTSLAFLLLDYGADPNAISREDFGSPWQELFAMIGHLNTIEEAYDLVNRFLDYGADPWKIPTHQPLADFLMQKFGKLGHGNVNALVQNVLNARQRQADLQENAKKSKFRKTMKDMFKRG